MGRCFLPESMRSNDRFKCQKEKIRNKIDAGQGKFQQADFSAKHQWEEKKNKTFFLVVLKQIHHWTKNRVSIIKLQQILSYIIFSHVCWCLLYVRANH